MASGDEDKLQPTRQRSLAASRHAFEFCPGGQDAVFPILKRTPTGINELVGTGFFVGPDGLFATAAHVFEGRDVGPNDDFWIIQAGGGHLVERPVATVYRHPHHDVALGYLGPAHDGCEDCSNHPVVALMELDPETHEVVGSFTYAHTIVHDPETHEFPDGEDLAQRILHRGHWEIGTAEHVYPDGLGNVTGHCIGTSVFVEGRGSGAPLFNSNGFVVGLNCVGFAAPEGLPHSTANSIRLLNEIDIEGRTLSEIRSAFGGPKAFRPSVGRIERPHRSWDEKAEPAPAQETSDLGDTD